MPAKSKQKPKYLAQSQDEIAAFCGQSIKTVQGWALQGMPGKKRGNYDLAEVVQWLRQSGPWRQNAKPAFAGSDDPLLVGNDADSDGLERYRQAKAALAELDLEERKGQLISREKVRPVLARWAAVIRRCGESLGKVFGASAAEKLNDALDECSRVVDDIGSAEPSDSDGTGGVELVPEAGESPDSSPD